jgi:hypothetical protein
MIEHLFKKIALVQFIIIIVTFTALIFVLNGSDKSPQTSSKKRNIIIYEKVFGFLNENEKVMKYNLRNANGFEFEVISYGATLKAIYVKDKNNLLTNVLLGFNTLQGVFL